MSKYFDPAMRFHRSQQEAHGYLMLGMRDQAIAALQAVTDDDGFIDQLYAEYVRESRYDEELKDGF